MPSYNMTMRWVYLDNNATTQPAPEVVEAFQGVYKDLWANPSSVHRFGQAVRHEVELARVSTAKLVGCRPREVIFTSGGTESNNLVLRGILGPHAGSRRVLITTKIEHSAIREPAKALDMDGVEVHYVGVDQDGLINPTVLQESLDQYASDEYPTLVSLQWANNETGIIQPVVELAQICYRTRQNGHQVLFHTDATQAVGKIPVDLTGIPVDLLTLSAHKFHGPKGVGVLVARPPARLRAQNLGGPQEREKRGGTENTAGIIAAGVAAELAQQFIADQQSIDRCRQLRDRLEQEICTQLPSTVINSGGAARQQRIWNTSNMGFEGLESEAILIGLSERGVCASAGAACSSGSLEPSPVLAAMGIRETVAHGSIRLSLSRLTRDEEIDQAVEIIPQVIRRLAQTMPVGK